MRTKGSLEWEHGATLPLCHSAGVCPLLGPIPIGRGDGGSEPEAVAIRGEGPHQQVGRLNVVVDVDDDGGAEIAWLNGDALEIWNVESGLEATLGL